MGTSSRMTVMCLIILHMQGDIAAAIRVYGTIGSDVEVTCTVKANNEHITWLGPPNYTVYGVGNVLYTSLLSVVTVTEHNKTYSTLKISKLSTENVGHYKCFYRDLENSFEIRIKKNPSNLRIANETNYGLIYGVEGTDLSLECTVNKGEPGGNITWQYDEHVLAVNGPEHAYFPFIPVRYDHNKVFTCTAYNGEGEKVESRSVKLFIFYKPIVTTSVEPSEVVREGQDLKLNCIHDGNDPLASIIWTRNGIKRPVKDGNLKLASVNRSEAGEYTCEVFSKGGNVVSSILIKIQPNFVRIEAFPSSTITEGDGLTLICHLVNTSVNNTITWKINNSVLLGTGHLHEYNSIHFTSIQRRQSGNYTCEIDTIYGKSNSTIFILVDEKDARSHMTQYSIITLVMITLGILLSFQISILIFKGLKRKLCKTSRQDSIHLGPHYAPDMNPQSHYDEIGSVYYGPVQTQGAINTREAQSEDNNSPTRSTILAGSNKRIKMPGKSHRISNETESTDSDDSYLVPCISRTEQSAEDSNNQAESVDGSSVSSNNSETILKSVRRYENLNCVYMTEHPYMPCPQLKANTQTDVQH